jgi:hypothetical protein
MQAGYLSEHGLGAVRVEGKQAIETAVEGRAVAVPGNRELVDQNRRLKHAGQRQRLVFQLIHGL